MVRRPYHQLFFCNCCVYVWNYCRNIFVCQLILRSRKYIGHLHSAQPAPLILHVTIIGTVYWYKCKFRLYSKAHHKLISSKCLTSKHPKCDICQTSPVQVTHAHHSNKEIRIQRQRNQYLSILCHDHQIQLVGNKHSFLLEVLKQDNQVMVSTRHAWLSTVQQVVTFRSYTYQTYNLSTEQKDRVIMKDCACIMLCVLLVIIVKLMWSKHQTAAVTAILKWLLNTNRQQRTTVSISRVKKVKNEGHVDWHKW